MEKKELEKMISEMEKKIETERKKREIKIVAIFTIVFYLVFYFIDEKPDEFGEYIKMLLVSFGLSFFHFVINRTVFERFFEADRYDRSVLCDLRKQLSEIKEKELAEYIKEYKQNG